MPIKLLKQTYNALSHETQSYFAKLLLNYIILNAMWNNKAHYIISHSQSCVCNHLTVHDKNLDLDAIANVEQCMIKIGD